MGLFLFLYKEDIYLNSNKFTKHLLVIRVDSNSVGKLESLFNLARARTCFVGYFSFFFFSDFFFFL